MIAWVPGGAMREWDRASGSPSTTTKVPVAIARPLTPSLIGERWRQRSPGRGGGCEATATIQAGSS
jgi:hypothetical protein